MRIVDLSLPINSRMTGLPGIQTYLDNPTRCFPLSVMSEAQAAILKRRGIEAEVEPEISNHMLSKVEITTHIGTHIDAPLHFSADGAPEVIAYFGDTKPASTTVQVARLVHPDWLVEIEATAIIDG